MNELTISDNIVRLRHAKRITQEQLADFIGVTKASVSKWENRQSTPDITILPQLATFFDVTVDELIGYSPQLSKEQIQHLYQKFRKDFSECSFEDVMEQTQLYVKRYYSCYPFLMQVCLLWINHYMLAKNLERQKEIWSDIVSLCSHIKENCKDIQLHSIAVVLQSLIYLQTGRVTEVIDELEDVSASNRFSFQSCSILAQAYTILGDHEKAEAFLQMSMYDNITNLMANAASYLSVQTDNLSVCEETIHRIEQIAETYQILHLNPNNLGSFEYHAALCYAAHGKKEQAVRHLRQYVLCLSELFSTDLHLHGDSYFTRLEEWFARELDNGTAAPRSRKIVLEEAKKTLDIPAFASLKGDPGFEEIKNKLKELI